MRIKLVKQKIIGKINIAMNKEQIGLIKIITKNF